MESKSELHSSTQHWSKISDCLVYFNLSCILFHVSSRSDTEHSSSNNTAFRKVDDSKKSGNSLLKTPFKFGFSFEVYRFKYFVVR